MKKVVSLLLVLTISFSIAIGIGVAEKEIEGVETRIAVITDVHIIADEYYTSNEVYNQYASEDKMVHLSTAILNTIVDNLIKNKKIKTVFIPGDMTENGERISHIAASGILKRLVDAGKNVFVINGNHDIHNRNETFPTASEFRDIYKDLGYNKAICKDTESFSYVADFDNNFRLIAIDGENYYNTDTNSIKENMDLRLIEWVKAQIEQCKKDGKTPIAMTHEPLLGHFPKLLGDIMEHGDDYIEGYDILATTLADNGVNYVFTGHMHGQDIQTKVTEKGNTLFDIETGSTVFVPVPYRIVTITRDNIEIKSYTVDKINMNYVSKYMAEKDYRMIENDFRGYMNIHFNKAIEDKINGKLNDALNNFNINGMSDLFDIITNEIINKLIYTPIYEGDTTNNQISVEEIFADYNVDLPQTDYKDFFDIASFIVATLDSGDENVSVESPELVLLKYYIMCIFYYIDNAKTEITELYPDAPEIDIDMQKLICDGELELFDSNIIGFGVYLFGDKLPEQFREISNLGLIKLFGVGILNSIIPKLGDEIEPFIFSKSIDFDSIIDKVVYEFMLSDFLEDGGPNDNDIIINRNTLIYQ